MAEQIESQAIDVSDAAIVKQDTRLAIERDPAKVLKEAHQAALALKDVISKKPKQLQFNGRTYLEYEDWLTVARFYGVTARVSSSQYVEYGDAKGFEATAEALLVSSDQVISRADALCLNDEENWGTRKKYKWLKNPQTGRAEKTQVGEEKVPLFQLKSMAQTRACAKALRNVLAWVVVLAGYAPTPAEEMGGIIDAKNEEGSTEAQEAVRDEKLAAIESGKSEPAWKKNKISEAQGKRLWAIAHKVGWTKEEIEKLLIGRFKIASVSDIPRGKYEEIVAVIETPEPPAPPEGEYGEEPF